VCPTASPTAHPVEEVEREWKEAEQIAQIADGMLTSDPRIDEELRRLRERLDEEKKRLG